MNFQVMLLIDHSIAVANTLVNIHIASAPSLNFRGVFDAFKKMGSAQDLSLTEYVFRKLL